MDNFVLGTIQETIKILQSDLNRINSSVLNLESNKRSTTNPGITVVGGSQNINKLTDVNITNLADNEILVYNSASSKWINSSSTGATAGPLSSLSDVNISNEQDKQSLVYNDASKEWINSSEVTASNVNLGTTGTIITNLDSGFPGMLLASGGATAAPSWVSDISVSSIQYPASRAKNTTTADGLTPATIYTNPSAATGGKFEISTKTVGDSLPTIKLTVNNAGAIGIGNSETYYDPFFAPAGNGPLYGAHGALLQSRGFDEAPYWLPRGNAGQYLTPAGGSGQDLIWVNLPSSGGLQTATLTLNQTWSIGAFSYPWQAGSRLGPEMPSMPYDVVYPASGLPSWMIIGTDNLITIQEAGYYKFEINQTTRWTGGLTFSRAQFYAIRNNYILSNFNSERQIGYDLVHAATIAPCTPNMVNSGTVNDWSFPEHHMFTVYMNAGDRMLHAHLRNVEGGTVYGIPFPPGPGQSGQTQFSYQMSITKLP